MPVNEDPKYRYAAKYYLCFPIVKSMIQAMRLAGFSKKEARSKKLQSRVRSTDDFKQMYRENKLLSNYDIQIQKERDEASEVTVPEALDTDSTASSTSTITHSSLQTTANKDGPTTRSFSAQKQKERELARAVRKRKCFALKEATIDYQREIEKENFQFSSPRKSARTIAKAIGQKHGTEVCYRSILENTEKGLFGQKRGSDYMQSKSQMDALKKEKRKRVELERTDAAARELLSQNIAPSDLKKDQLVLLLRWHGIAKKDIPTNNPDRLEKWLQVKDDTPPSFPKWTLEDEAKIAKLEPPDDGHIVEDTVIRVDLAHEFIIEFPSLKKANEFISFYQSLSAEDKFQGLEDLRTVQRDFGNPEKFTAFFGGHQVVLRTDSDLISYTSGSSTATSNIDN